MKLPIESSVWVVFLPKYRHVSIVIPTICQHVFKSVVSSQSISQSMCVTGIIISPQGILGNAMVVIASKETKSTMF